MEAGTLKTTSSRWYAEPTPYRRGPADAAIPGLYAAGEVAEWNARGGYATADEMFAAMGL